MDEIPQELSLILDSEELAKMGIHSEAIYSIEYDLKAEKKIPEKATAFERKEIKRINKLTRDIRNALIYRLKWRIKATKHLESSWIITKDKLKIAIEELEDLKAEMKAKGFKDVDRRLRIIPMLTTEVGFESYESLKQQFLLDFATEHIAYCDKALDNEEVNMASLWRCKQAYEIITSLAAELKSGDQKTEVLDTVALLSDKIAQVEQMKLQLEEEEK